MQAPYDALIGFVWNPDGCCHGFGEGSLAFFFGDANLFDLGEIEASINLPVLETFTISLHCQFLMSGTHTIAFGWEMGICAPHPGASALLLGLPLRLASPGDGHRDF